MFGRAIVHRGIRNGPEKKTTSAACVHAKRFYGITNGRHKIRKHRKWDFTNGGTASAPLTHTSTTCTHTHTHVHAVNGIWMLGYVFDVHQTMSIGDLLTQNRRMSTARMPTIQWHCIYKYSHIVLKTITKEKFNERNSLRIQFTPYAIRCEHRTSIASKMRKFWVESSELGEASYRIGMSLPLSICSYMCEQSNTHPFARAPSNHRASIGRVHLSCATVS